MFPNKTTTRASAIERYGAIDFASRHWPEQSKWIQLLPIPAGMFPEWMVLDTKIPVTHIACNVDIHGPLMSALKSVHDQGLGHHLKTFDGCFNIRMVRGSNESFSAHSYGLAIDIDASENQMSQILDTTFPHDFVKCFTDQGFDWGGGFRSRKDPMHFSYCWE